jgi:hypothetical protein
MKTLLRGMLLICLALPALAQVTTLKQEVDVDPELDRAIRQLIEATGALEIGEQFANAISMQMTQTLRQTNPDIPPRAFDIIQQEVMTVIGEELANGSFEDQMVPVYARYFNLQEVEELLAFYHTAIGQKTVEVMPLLTQESMQVGQNWGIGIGPIVGRRVTQRLAAEGIVLD